MKRLKMLKAIYMPWRKGIGTLGFRFSNWYLDLYISSGARRLCAFVSDTLDSSPRKRWYRLTLRGWQLVKQEDRWGHWHHGRHFAPLGSAPRATDGWENGIAQRAWDLRNFFKPYQLRDWYGTQVEVMSFPSPERNRVTLMVRTTPGDCTTLAEITLEEYTKGGAL